MLCLNLNGNYSFILYPYTSLHIYTIWIYKTTTLSYNIHFNLISYQKNNYILLNPNCKILEKLDILCAIIDTGNNVYLMIFPPIINRKYL